VARLQRPARAVHAVSAVILHVHATCTAMLTVQHTIETWRASIAPQPHRTISCPHTVCTDCSQEHERCKPARSHAAPSVSPTHCARAIPVPKTGDIASNNAPRCPPLVNTEGTCESGFVRVRASEHERHVLLTMLVYKGTSHTSHAIPPWALDELLALVSQR